MIGILGLFPEPHEMELAACDSKWDGRETVKISPVPPHHLEKSPVRYFTLTGALLGLTAGFLSGAYTSLKYGLIVSGKPLVANLSYGVVMFELMVLFATIFSLGAVLLLSILPVLFKYRLKPPPWHRAELTLDKWGLYVECRSEDEDEFSKKMKELGAERVEKVFE